MISKTRELRYGEYAIEADSGKTGRLYEKRGQYFLKCACPGCQNFFKSVKPYGAELEAYLSPLGADWKKPDKIEVLFAENDIVLYRVIYKFYGRALSRPKRWVTEKNDLGTINTRGEGSVFPLNNALALSFKGRGKGETAAEITARLPWVMETLKCVYDENVQGFAKKIPSRSERIRRAAKEIKERKNA